MHRNLNPAYTRPVSTIVYLVAGIFFASGILSLTAGRTLAKGREGWVYRDADPTVYWSAVSAYLFMSGFFVYIVHRFHL